MSGLPEVVMATVNGEKDVVVFRGRGIFAQNWYTPGPVAGSRTSVSDSWITDRRPLLLIDPEDEEQVTRLTGALVLHDATPNDTNHWREVQAALRSLPQPATPEPSDPAVRVWTTGPVRDGNTSLPPARRQWAKVGPSWWSDAGCNASWDDILAAGLESPS